MSICPSCTLDVHPAARFCGRCGAPLAYPLAYPRAVVAAVPDPYANLNGIAGWLILIAVSLAFTPFAIVSNALRIEIPTLLHFHSSTGSAVALYLLFKHAGLFIVLIFLNGMFYSKRRDFPSAMIAYHLFVLCIHLGEPVLYAVLSPHSAVPNFSRAVMASIISCAIWIPYLSLSRRVKQTFVC